MTVAPAPAEVYFSSHLQGKECFWGRPVVLTLCYSSQGHSGPQHLKTFKVHWSHVFTPSFGPVDVEQ